MIDRIVRKLAISALLAACVDVTTIARAQSDESARAGAIGSSLATKAVLGARTPAGAAGGGSGVPIEPDWGAPRRYRRSFCNGPNIGFSAWQSTSA
jgi:hypothetical protein